MNPRAELISELTRVIASALADERVRRHTNDQLTATDEEERNVARSAAVNYLSRLGPQQSWSSIVSADGPDRGVVEEAIARILGMGRLEPLLEDGEITDIHVRGCAPVWVKRRDGSRVQCPPIVESDAELIELVRRVATRLTRREQRFDAATPELNVQLSDGSRLFAAMDISIRPTMVIRRHRFEFSSLVELCARSMMTPDVAMFLAAAVRARKNIVVAGGTGTGKTTLLRALVNEVPMLDRIVSIEDAYELGLDHFEDLHPNIDA
jgi:Flp pilus assembly CpaF family ATPase